MRLVTAPSAVLALYSQPAAALVSTSRPTHVNGRAVE
jgi:hypothetical protein